MTQMPSAHYVLITPAKNEAANIEKLIQSVIQQAFVPAKWVIVDDGSVDGTAEIVKRYLPQHRWIELIQVPKAKERSFAGKVMAFNAGLERLRKSDYEVIGNVDADVSFDSDYCSFLVEKFRVDPQLGVAGSVFKEVGYSSATDSFEGQNHVAGGCQFFRRRCFEEIGGYVPNPEGGIDWIAVTTARMRGWKTRSFQEKCFVHYRPLGTATRGVLASAFSYGEKDYYLGGHPVWELFRIAYRVTKRPYVVGGIALYSGYLSAFVRQMPRAVSEELMRFHRREQIARLKDMLRSMVRLQKVDSFECNAP
jgi:glycosyltransferase involved in cell wall biosynthesis